MTTRIQLNSLFMTFFLVTPCTPSLPSYLYCKSTLTGRLQVYQLTESILAQAGTRGKAKIISSLTIPGPTTCEQRIGRGRKKIRNVVVLPNNREGEGYAKAEFLPDNSSDISSRCKVETTKAADILLEV